MDMDIKMTTQKQTINKNCKHMEERGFRVAQGILSVVRFLDCICKLIFETFLSSLLCPMRL
jgi:hypothetical protein